MRATKLETFFQRSQGASRKWPDQLEYQLVRMRKHHFSNNAKADVFNYREKLKLNPLILLCSTVLRWRYKTNEHDQALALMRGLKSKISSRIFYHASLAQLLIAAQELDSAQSLLREQLALYPDNFPLAMLYAQALIADEQYISAESVLESQSKLRPQDTHVWFCWPKQPVLQVMSRVCIWPELSTFICTVHYIAPFSIWNMLSDWCANRTQ